MSKVFERICPSCGTKLVYKSYNTHHYANKHNQRCKRCSLIGENNPFYGKRHSEETRKIISEKASNQINHRTSNNWDVWVEKYGAEEATRRQNAYKAKQSELNSGANNSMYGKPAPQGSGNGWSGWYKNWYFRSLRELCYLINHVEANNQSWISAEQFRIPYKDYDGKERTYSADFLVDNKYLVEVKPEKLFNSTMVRLKKEAAEIFCVEKGYEYLLIDPGQPSNEQIKMLHDSGQIRFLESYERKYQEKYAD